MRLLTIAAVLLATSPVAADWQWTKWGQSVDAVLSGNASAKKATAQDVKDYSNRLGEMLVEATHDVRWLPQKARFYFADGNALSSVALEIPDVIDATIIRDWLRQQYGRSDDFKPGTASRICDEATETWRVPSANNLIVLETMDCPNNTDLSRFRLTYTPMPTSETSGL